MKEEEESGKDEHMTDEKVKEKEEKQKEEKEEAEKEEQDLEKEEMEKEQEMVCLLVPSSHLTPLSFLSLRFSCLCATVSVSVFGCVLTHLSLLLFSLSLSNKNIPPGISLCNTMTHTQSGRAGQGPVLGPASHVQSFFCKTALVSSTLSLSLPAGLTKFMVNHHFPHISLQYALACHEALPGLLT